MKKLLALFAFLLILSGANAQKLVVRDFKSLPRDQTAMNPETKRTDQNGKRAALIRIYTPLKLSDINFGGSAVGFVEAMQLPGQILLFIPERSQQIDISHNRFSHVIYHYEEPIEAGRTYSMSLTVEGKEISFASSTEGADLIIDGDTIGKTPVRAYIPYGVHNVKAQLGSLLYDNRIDISPNGPNSYDLKLQDENLKYGDVTVTVPGNAEIYFQGRREGVGAATFHLKDGVYPVETRKPNHDNRVTNVQVRAGQAITVPLTPPEPHTGYLELRIEPVNNVAIMSADTVFSESNTMHLPVGQYELSFRRNGYFTQNRVYDINRGLTTYDTVRLVRKQYVKPAGIYAGVGFTYSKMPGVTLFAGGLFHNIDLSVGYTFGVTKSDPVDWYQDETELFAERTRYRMDELSVKAGYQFALAERFGITPQAGYMAQMLHGEGTKGNGFTCSNISVGVKATWVPVPRFGIYLNPEYAIPVSAGDEYSKVAKYGGFDKGGFHVSLGAYIYIM